MPTTALTGRAQKGQNARQDRGAGTSRAAFSLQRLLPTTLEHVVHLAPGAARPPAHPSPTPTMES